MVKLRFYMCVLGVLSSTSMLATAQSTPVANPDPVANPAIPSPVSPSPIIPGPIDPPIDPPIETPAIPEANGAQTPLPPATDNGLPPEGSLPGVVPLGVAPSNPNAVGVHEFQGDEVALVLRALARQAGMNIVISEKVVGPVTMRLENKTAHQALDVIIKSKGLTITDDEGVFYVKTQDERAKEPAESGNYTFSYAVAKDVLPLLDKQLVSGIASQYDVRTNTVFFKETHSNMDKVLLFLETIDIPTQQVMIEARLVEVTANPRQSYGINWAGVVGGSASPQTFKYGGSQPAAPPHVVINAAGNPVLTPGDPASFLVDSARGTLKSQDFFLDGNAVGNFGSALAGQFAILSIPQMSATLRLLNEDGDTEFLANPRIVTSNNQKAEIKITRAQPVPQLTFNEQSASAVFSGFEDKEYGNTLVVTPTVNKDNFVSMNVKPEISNKVGDAIFVFQSATVTSPIIDKRALESNVLIKSGDTLAIGGLLQDETTKQRTKVPVLGDIPIIGYAFQERLNNRNKRNLLIFVTPTIIKQGYGTGLEDQTNGLHHSGDEFADPNGWRSNAKGSWRLTPTSNRAVAADVAAPGVAPAPASKHPVRTKKRLTVAQMDAEAAKNAASKDKKNKKNGTVSATSAEN